MPPDSVGVGALDYPMTSEELEKTKHLLKKARAGGLDTISNEMISCFLHLLLLFLLMFLCKSFSRPQTWGSYFEKRI